MFNLTIILREREREGWVWFMKMLDGTDEWLKMPFVWTYQGLIETIDVRHKTERTSTWWTWRRQVESKRPMHF